MPILVTGAAGFIGYHVSLALLERGEQVVGIDNLNDYYDPNLKLARLAQLDPFDDFEFKKQDVSHLESVQELFEEKKFSKVIHLAAQAGVRYSLENPMAYIQSNIVGFQSILEACRLHGVQHLVYASSSSVYGNSDKVPFSTTDSVDHPVSTYAATKKSNELMAHVYSHLYKLPTTGLRFFTVYGPWGRPDMSPFLFAKSIFGGEPIQVFNYGNHSRDFTFVDDISQGLLAVLDKPPHQGTDTGATPYKVYNIGRGEPVQLLDYIRLMEKEIGSEAVLNLVPKQPGDVDSTHANVADLIEDIGYAPSTELSDGIRQFIIWYRKYFGL